ncbi:site-specific integrase [Pedobacter sp. UBA4863]|uniref:site-specific integrase n=1 Tax=Pedobacter sp. UBA4863 TaxID=1947060 RepID=UPI0025D2E031|nr:site-specific integrase [Pedobacter sp. UBA4863]
MATVSAKVYEHHKRSDGTYNVKICVYHRKQRKFIDTNHFVVKKQLTSKLTIKDSFILNLVEAQLIGYRKTISELGDKLIFFTAEDLRNYLCDKDEEVDFIKFCEQHIANLRSEGREGTANNHRAIRNSLIDYFRRAEVSINEINSNMLISYEKFLRGERKMERLDSIGRLRPKVEAGLSDSGLHNHMRDLRTLFNAARNRYNNEDLGLYKIKHYPFKKYKIGSPPLTKKRNNKIDEVLAIRDCSVIPESRTELARDLYMLSLYLCGMNAVDIYNLTSDNIKNGRIEYNRSKTEARRRDNAFISIKIVAEAKPLLDKYLEKLKERYVSSNGLNAALAKGMKEVCKLTGLKGVTLYWARHTFASTARNECRVSKDDIALALNHIDNGHQTTDIYIAKDWSIIDDVQAKVLKSIRNRKNGR